MTNNVFDKDQNHLMTNLLILYLMIFVEYLYHELILVLNKKKTTTNNLKQKIKNFDFILGRFVVNDKPTDLLNKCVEICSAYTSIL
jgi:hypothetical protein